jgi:hypothetical protein
MSIKNGWYNERTATHAKTAGMENEPVSTQSIQSHADITTSMSFSTGTTVITECIVVAKFECI